MIYSNAATIIGLLQIGCLYGTFTEDDEFTAPNYSDTVLMKTCREHGIIHKKYETGIQHKWYCPEYPFFNWSKEYIPCFQCRKIYIGACPIHGPLKVLKNTPVVEEDLHRAIHSLSQGLSIRKSSIEGAGLGVFTHINLPPGLRMGPYEGYFEDGNDYEYTWLYRFGDKDITVNGRNVSHSNWLRFVNMPNCRRNENLKWIVYKEQIFYVTFKPITAGSELLVWYGMNYANYLGIDPDTCIENN